MRVSLVTACFNKKVAKYSICKFECNFMSFIFRNGWLCVNGLTNKITKQIDTML